MTLHIFKHQYISSSAHAFIPKRKSSWVLVTQPKGHNWPYLMPWSHISVINASPGYTCKRNRPDMLFTMFGSPLQMHLMIALTANPSVHNPCSIGRENLWWHNSNRFKSMSWDEAVITKQGWKIQIRLKVEFSNEVHTLQLLQSQDLSEEGCSHQIAYIAMPAKKEIRIN